jgi:hypothetical protein
MLVVRCLSCFMRHLQCFRAFPISWVIINDDIQKERVILRLSIYVFENYLTRPCKRKKETKQRLAYVKHRTDHFDVSMHSQACLFQQ